MPSLSGVEVLNAVTRDGLPTRIVLLTGFGESGPLYEAMALGAGAYLAKDAGQGNPGQGFIRVALVAPADEVRRGLGLIRDVLY